VIFHPLPSSEETLFQQAPFAFWYDKNQKHRPESTGVPNLVSHRSLRRALPYLVFCGYLAAQTSAASLEGVAVPEPAAWFQTLWSLPVLRWFAPNMDKPAAKLPGQPPPPALPPCSVEPLQPVTDPDAMTFENATAPNVGGLKPAMVRALNKFRQLVTSVGGSFELKSAYRPPAYQAHLQQVWYKWMELRNNRAPGCQVLRAQVETEFTRHDLLESQKPVTFSDHTRGLAFDATVRVPAAARLKKRRVSLDRLALLAGIHRPDVHHDPVHFKLWASRGVRRV
jgi:hypothetical protein